MKEKELLEAAAQAEDMEPFELDNIHKRLEEFEKEKVEQKALSERPSQEWWDRLDIKDHMYPDLALTPDEQHRVMVASRFLKTGLAAHVPMICSGRNRCPFARGWERGGGHCEYAKLQKEPLGKPCIIEMDLIIDRTKQYAQQFEVGSDPDEVVDRLQCMELAEYDVYEKRVTHALSGPEMAELTEENVIGVDEAQNPVYAKQIALAWHLKVQIKNRRDRVLKSLVATREAKYKRDAALGTTEETDHATGFSSMMGILKGMQKQEEIVVEPGDYTEE